jgi:hypothetical protein
MILSVGMTTPSNTTAATLGFRTLDDYTPLTSREVIDRNGVLAAMIHARRPIGPDQETFVAGLG